LKIGVFTAAFEPSEGWDLERILHYLSGLGYEAVEISAKRHIDAERVLSGGASHVKDLLSKYNMIASALSYHVNHLNADVSRREEANSRFKKVIEAAAQLDIPVVNSFSGLGVPFHILYPHPMSNVPKVEAAWNDLGNVLGELADFAGKHGVKIGIETHFGYMVYNIRTSERMLEKVPSKSLGFNYDPSHLVWQGIDPVLFIRRFRDRLYHMHAKDTEMLSEKITESGLLAFTKEFRWPCESWRFRIPGYGNINWGRLIAELKNVGYDYVMSLEYEDSVFTREEACEKTVKILKAFL